MRINQLQELVSADDELIQISKEQLQKLLATASIPKTPVLEKPKQSSQKIVLKVGHKKVKPYQFADVNYWTVETFSWDQQVWETLRGAFGKDQFKPNQKAIINCVLSRKDVFVCMPTGYGKSITFQIPACVENGVSIVVMPLISLIYDQVHYLTNIGIQTLNVSGSNKLPTAQFIIENKIKLLYTTPEKIEKNDYLKQVLQELNSKQLLQRFVIDEAHCVSKWGRDFRPDYLKLTNIRTLYPKVPIIALTATAPEEVKEDIIDVLQIKGCYYLQSSFNRPNLIYDVRQREKAEKSIQEIKEFINFSYPRQSGIIYCLTQNECENLSKSLKKMGIDAEFYHAGIGESERNNIHKNWLMNEVQVIVATIAFGMGIDKKDCRFVIHYQMPKSIENYYQESGRAGRDGKKAHCLLFFNPNDYKTNLFLMDRDEIPAKLKKYNIMKLDQMQSYCYDKISCRRELQLSYLGEKFEKKNCNKSCDNCIRDTSESTQVNLTSEAQTVLTSILKFPITENQLINCLKGCVDKKQKEKKFSQGTESIYGLFKHNQKQIQPFIEGLRQQNLLVQKIQQINNPKMFRNKIVYVTTTQELLQKFQSLIINFYKEQKKSGGFTSDNVTNDLFSKYLKKDPQKQQQQQYYQPVENKQTSNPWNFSIKTLQQQDQKLLMYDKYFGYCTNLQFDELRERLMLVRNQIYKEFISRQQADKVLTIDLILCNDDIDELCRKIPLNQAELNNQWIRIADAFKKKNYLQIFLDEIIHFVDTEEIDKNKFTIPNDTDNTDSNNNQIFEFQKHIRQDEEYEDPENDVMEIPPPIDEQQLYIQQIEEMLQVNNQPNNQTHDNNDIQDNKYLQEYNQQIDDDVFIYIIQFFNFIEEIENSEKLQQKLDNNKKERINLKRTFL